ncbi:bifunctional DNA-formamidopyrimidine glycosylase/DNA-(apurinic or apyrimidinic site) lyase [Candidatus Shapirobacteria bacterium]|nr:bifunctional DNA-formamidopyrimidine glycosylase/DNA-(apurinic or apyrimidinic site) lyase [Candidatus Shapirobacteria bacterium]
MPELPEVETIARSLSQSIVGKRIAAVKIFEKKQFIGDPDQIISAKVEKVFRRAKILGLALDNKLALLFHLKLTGQIIFFADHRLKEELVLPAPLPFADNKLPGKTTRIIIEFSDGSRLFFNDLRKFGWVKIIKSEKLKVKNLEYGPEPRGEDFSPDYLVDIFSKTRRPIKIVLMDQKKIAGLGNIYANEVLFAAGIDPRRPANSLTRQEIAKLYEAIIKILQAAIKAGGTSAADDAYVKPDATSGGYQRYLKVYQQAGKPCPRCRKGIIKRLNLAGRGTFFCPCCQK